MLKGKLKFWCRDQDVAFSLKLAAVLLSIGEDGGKEGINTIVHTFCIDLQQVYLLQSEAQKDKTLTFICEYFRHHGRVKHWQHLLTKRNNLDFKTFTF